MGDHMAGQLALLEAEDGLKSKRIAEIQDFLEERMQELRQKEADLEALRSQTSAADLATASFVSGEVS